MSERFFPKLTLTVSSFETGISERRLGCESSKPHQWIPFEMLMLMDVWTGGLHPPSSIAVGFLSLPVERKKKTFRSSLVPCRTIFRPVEIRIPTT